jgi:hypothetical protein
MNLSSELISQFVKITKDDKKIDNGSTVYGTIVEYEGTKCVKLDGSDQITPITSTADVLPGDRVAVLIKNHTATVTGNVSSPSARKETVDEVEKTVNEHGSKLDEFELVVADMVTTEQLNATQANIETLIAKKVSVEQLEAERAEIDELLAEKATVKQLEVVDGKFETLDTKFLTADAAELKYATIENLNATNIKVNTLEGTYGEFEDLTTSKFQAIDADIKTLNAEKASVKDLNATNAKIDNLDATYAKITDLDATNINVGNLQADVAEVNELVAKKANITDLNATNAKIDNLDATYAKITDLDATNINVGNLQADVADIDTLIFGSATGTSIQTSFANAVIAQLGNAQIKSAMIDTVSADKINAGTVNTNNINIASEDGRLSISDETIQISDDTRVRVQIGKDASNDYSINIWDVDGNLMFSKGGITDNAIKDAIIRNDMVSDTANISASKLDISSLFKEINGSTETIKSTKIYLDDEKQTLDVAFTQMSSDVDDLSNDVSSQGTQISVIQGQISSKVWQQDIDTATDELGGEIDTLTTKQSTLEQTVNGISTTVSQHESQIANKADGSTVTAVNDKVSELETNLNGFKSSVSETYATKTDLSGTQDDVSELTTKQSTLEQTVNGISTTVGQHTTQIASKADGSTVTNVTNRVGALETSVDGLSNTVSSHTTQIAAKADGSEVTAVNTKVTNLESNLNGFKSTVSETYATQTALNGVENALDKRLDTAETTIDQNTKDITLRATKSELSTNYYDKIQTNAQIKISSDAITNTVNGLSGKVSTLEQTAQGLSVSVADAAKTATSFMAYDATNGLQVGNKQNGSWSGYRTQVKDYAFNILDASGNELASYGANKVDLGKNNQDAVIGFCNDKMQIACDVHDRTGAPQAVMQADAFWIGSKYSTVLKTSALNPLTGNTNETLIQASETQEGSPYVLLKASTEDEAYNVTESTFYLWKDSAFLEAESSITLDAPTVTVQGDHGITGHYYDNLGQPIRNGLAAYSGSGINPNTTLEELILTSHANAPQGSGTFYYIHTMFYNTKSETAARAQVAYPYNKLGLTYRRYYYSGAWSAWTNSALDAYPVGSYYISGRTTSPASLFGGTWTRISSRFLWASPDDTNVTGGLTAGEMSHTLTVSEMPSHTHKLDLTSTAGTGSYSTEYVAYTKTGGTTYSNSNAVISSGGGEAHNNMPPYICVAIWKRTG